MIKACLYMCGPIVGYFPDKHSLPEDDKSDSDEENSDDEMLRREGRGKVFKPVVDKKLLKQLKKGKLVSDNIQNTLLEGSGIGIVWTPFLINTQMEVENVGNKIKLSVQGIKVKGKPLPKALMEKLDTIHHVRIFDVTNSNLENLPDDFCREFDTLIALRLTNNRLTTLQKASLDAGSGKTSNLKELQVGGNMITQVAPGCLAGRNVARMMILDLSKNHLEILPLDFLAGAVEIKFLDVSFNRLTSLPNSILQCSKMLIFHCSNNNLKALPELGQLRDLRKLFISNNDLEHLPENIGNCNKLVKLRLLANRVQIMPRSAVKLWKQKGGMLEELLIAGNPMVQPSITAYDLGGLDQCLRLFSVWVEGEERREAELVAAADILEKADKEASCQETSTIASASAPEASRKKVDVDGSPRSLVHARRNSFESCDSLIENFPGVGSFMLESPCTQQSPRGRSLSQSLNPFSSLDLEALRARRVVVEEPTPRSEAPSNPAADALDASAARDLRNGQKFYFQGSPGHHDEPADMIQKVRSAQSATLFKKRKSFVEQKMREAIDARVSGRPVPPEYQQCLDENFSVTTFAGPVSATELDISLILLVYSLKPLYSTCTAMFKKFANPGVAVMRWDNWLSFCKRAPVRIKASIQERMFHELCPENEVEFGLIDFIATCQIYDIELRDPWVRCMASALRLEYFEMTLEGLDLEMTARAAQVELASAKPSADKSAAQSEHEGDASDARRELNEALHASATTMTMSGQDNGRHLFQISLTDLEYGRAHQARDSDEKSPRSQCSLSSGNLSTEVDTEESEFDAAARMQDVALIEKELHSGHTAALKEEHFEVRNDKDLERLMALPPERIGKQKQEEKVERQRSTKSKQTYWNREGRVRGRGETKVHDSRFATDMLSVRQGLREAERNLPAPNYSAFINFLVRGVRTIKYDNAPDAITYWNCEDPVFREIVGVNRYTEGVLVDMGFILVNDTYWVWPLSHLHANADAGHWGHLVIPPRCLGTHPGRLEEVLDVLQEVQRQIAKAAAERAA